MKVKNLFFGSGLVDIVLIIMNSPLYTTAGVAKESVILNRLRDSSIYPLPFFNRLAI
jgi:hypothetical protein